MESYAKSEQIEMMEAKVDKLEKFMKQNIASKGNKSHSIIDINELGSCSKKYKNLFNIGNSYLR